ncbi:MAG: ATP-dependent Clp protease adaptor ClpS [Lachnospiraceae bacterium]|nr:ATP-dependent Clp protease adaptor ClpS [Lachnospiraceae bacterium]
MSVDSGKKVRQDEGCGAQSSVRIKPKKPSLYKVIMLNDDVTTMDFVVDILKDIFNKSHEEAVELMLKVHNNGSAVIAVYIYDVAKTKQRKAMERARAMGFPFRIDIERE